ncbi:MAG: hypothetical protein KKH29_03710 [Candidatus Omnitrophica bacterium]|nr:hypothetical protein [Candidatus Omnitrophota bacterium]MCG2706798.1 hypothetical protein [Candidatus Omnitrophota bacterium]
MERIEALDFGRVVLDEEVGNFMVNTVLGEKICSIMMRCIRKSGQGFWKYGVGGGLLHFVEE